MHLRSDLIRTTAAATTATIYDIEDPLGHDEHDDRKITITRRALTRVAFVAAETASRFQREAIEYDPMAWLFAPRRLFDGEAAIDACLERSAFQRAVIFHGLSHGLDADREEIEELLIEDDDDIEDGDDEDFEWKPNPWSSFANGASSFPMRLFSVTIDHQTGGKVEHGFHASMASNMSEFRTRVAGIFGDEILDHAVLCEGVNPSIRMVEDLVSPDLMQTLIAGPAYEGRRVAITAQRLVELDS